MSEFPLETIRHSAAHVMAAAVKQLYPDAKFDIGPATENGFYYDFDMEHRLVNEDLKDLLPNIRQSTLLIWGTADTATPLSDAKLMEQLLPDAGLAEIPGVGHYSFLENPALFNAIISSFLKL